MPNFSSLVRICFAMMYLLLTSCAGAPVEVNNAASYSPPSVHIMIESVEVGRKDYQFLVGKKVSAVADIYGDDSLYWDFCGTSTDHEVENLNLGDDIIATEKAHTDIELNASIIGVDTHRSLIDGRVVHVIHLRLKD